MLVVMAPARVALHWVLIWTQIIASALCKLPTLWSFMAMLLLVCGVSAARCNICVRANLMSVVCHILASLAGLGRCGNCYPNKYY